MTQHDSQSILDLINREVVPAMGCTEPIAVALGVARATELLGTIPDKIYLRLSPNIVKNAMGVGIPGTGKVGLPVAVALGAIIGKSEYGLEVLRDVTSHDVERAADYVSRDCISIKTLYDSPSILHIEVDAEGAGHSARAVISGSHTNFIYLEQDGHVLLDASCGTDETGEGESPELDMETVWNFAMTMPLQDIEFILEAERLNMAAAEPALTGDTHYGHSLGRTLINSGQPYFGNTLASKIIAYTSAACDARMGGAPIAVMTNSGSGNQGITATIPVVCMARHIGASREHLVRALILSHLTSIYIKQSLGRLSALCGCVVASTGASAGMTYLMGGDYATVCAAIKNMIANLTGMICDGAKPACAMKISSGVSTALMSALMACNGHCVSSAEGIIDDDIDTSIHNLTSIGREAMRETDRKVLDIMVCK